MTVSRAYYYFGLPLVRQDRLRRAREDPNVWHSSAGQAFDAVQRQAGLGHIADWQTWWPHELLPVAVCCPGFSLRGWLPVHAQESDDLVGAVVRGCHESGPIRSHHA